MRTLLTSLARIILQLTLLTFLGCSGGGADVVAPPPPQVSTGPPQANADQLEALTGLTASIDLLANDLAFDDTFLEPASVNYFEIERIDGDSVSVVNGVLDYCAPSGSVPDGQITEVRFAYEVKDSDGRASNLAIITVAVSAGVPIANIDQAQVSPGESILIDVLANDVAFGGAELSGSSAIQITSEPSVGLTSIEFGKVRYVCPEGALAGVDIFQYRAIDSAGRESEPADVLVEIVGGPIPPLARPDSAVMVTTQASVEIDVTLNDEAFGGSSLDLTTVSIDQTPALGEVVVSPLGVVTYSLQAGQDSGEIEFSYTVRDTNGLESDPALVTVQVVPPGFAPTANDDYGVVEAGTEISLDLLANDLVGSTGAQLDGSSIEVVGASISGAYEVSSAGEFVYTAARNPSTATESYLYRVADASGVYSGYAAIEISLAGAGVGGSSAVSLSANGLSSSVFHASPLSLELSASGGELALTGVALFVNGQRVEPTSAVVASTEISLGVPLESGLNVIRVIATDVVGMATEWSEVVYSGSRVVNVRLVDANGSDVGGTVRFLTVGFRPIAMDYPVPAGGASIHNVPSFSMGLRGRNGTQVGASFLENYESEVEIAVDDLLPVASFNGDFVSGLEGWDVSNAQAAELVGGELHLRSVNTDQQQVRHCFEVPATTSQGLPVRQVEVHYRVATDEPTGDTVPQAFDDNWLIALRAGDQLKARIETLRDLGPNAFDPSGETVTRVVATAAEPGTIFEVDARVENVGGAGADTTLIVEAVKLRSVAAQLDSLRNQEGGRLDLLSVGLHNGYGGTSDAGNTLIGGRLRLQFAPGTSPPDLVLEVVRHSDAGPNILAFPTARLSTEIANSVATGELDTGVIPDLFEIRSFQAQMLGDLQGFVAYRLRYPVGSESLFEEVSLLSFPLLSLPDDSAVRIGSNRNPELGGDGWLLAPLAPAIQSATFLAIGDCSRMNGGPFPGRKGHEWGTALQAWRPGYAASTSEGAQAILSLFEIAEFGQYIEAVRAAFVPVPGDAMFNALSNAGFLPDGRPVLDVVIPDLGQQGSFKVHISPNALFAFSGGG